MQHHPMFYSNTGHENPGAPLPAPPSSTLPCMSLIAYQRHIADQTHSPRAPTQVLDNLVEWKIC